VSTAANSLSLSLNAKQAKLFRLATPPPPVLNTIVRSGGSLIFSGTNGVASGNYVVLTSTNVTTPMISWVALMTNTFDVNGAFHVTNAVAPGTPQLFYRIQLQ
jgi:hypothetical protein